MRIGQGQPIPQHRLLANGDLHGRNGGLQQMVFFQAIEEFFQLVLRHRGLESLGQHGLNLGERTTVAEGFAEGELGLGELEVSLGPGIFDDKRSLAPLEGLTRYD